MERMPFQKYFSQDFDSQVSNAADSVNKSREIIELLGLEYVESWQMEEGADLRPGGFAFRIEEQSIVTVTGYDYQLRGLNFFSGDSVITVENEATKWEVSNDFNAGELVITEQNSGREIIIDITEFAANLRSNYSGESRPSKDIPESDMVLQSSNEEMEVQLVVSFISGSYDEEQIQLTNFTTDIFVSLR